VPCNRGASGGSDDAGAHDVKGDRSENQDGDGRHEYQPQQGHGERHPGGELGSERR
jgi:hypothetical protein